MPNETIKTDQKSSLTPIPPQKYTTELLTKVTGDTGVPHAMTKDVAIGLEEPLRTMIEQKAVVELIKLIPVLAEQYGGRKDISEEVLTECVAVVFEKFAGLGINEIRRAYRMWACGELDLDNSVEMWGGVFNVKNFTGILNAYKQHRGRVAIKLMQLREEQERQNDIERKQKEFDSRFTHMVADWDGHSWEDVPSNWYEAAIRLGLIDPPTRETYPQYWKDALKASKEEYSARYNEAKPKERKKMNQLQEMYVELYAKPIARKMWVYDHLLKSE